MTMYEGDGFTNENLTKEAELTIEGLCTTRLNSSFPMSQFLSDSRTYGKSHRVDHRDNRDIIHLQTIRHVSNALSTFDTVGNDNHLQATLNQALGERPNVHFNTPQSRIEKIATLGRYYEQRILMIPKIRKTGRTMAMVCLGSDECCGSGIGGAE